MIDIQKLREAIKENDEDLNWVSFEEYHQLLMEKSNEMGFMKALLFFVEKGWIIEDYLPMLKDTTFGEQLYAEQKKKNVFRTVNIFNIFDDDYINETIKRSKK